MKILVIGSGGREHALVWKLAQSSRVSRVYVAPGNGGTESEGAENIPIQADDIEGLVHFAKENAVDLVVPGPELPLTMGITDAMKQAGIACFGPDSYCAQLEGSKAFAKEIMGRSNVPTAAMTLVTDLERGRAVLQTAQYPVVVKADGLAQGKGVVICQNREEAELQLQSMLQDQVFGDAGSRVLIEEYLTGEEVSLLCLCDGKKAWPLPSAQDHKRAFDGDKGANTGGMGAYSPAPVLPEQDLDRVCQTCVQPILDCMRADGHPFVGILYAGLMITKDGPKVLEYNVRFGDPECQPLLMRLESDLVDCMLGCLNGSLNDTAIRISPKTALGIVIAKEGYPGSYTKGSGIFGIPDAEALPDVKVFHSGTKKAGAALVSNGGRILCVTCLGDSVQACQNTGYEAVKKISIEKSFYRHDIGAKAIAHTSR